MEYVFTGGRGNGKEKLNNDFMDALRYARIYGSQAFYANPEPFVKIINDEDPEPPKIIDVEAVNARSVVAGTFMTGHCPKCKEKDIRVLEDQIEDKMIMRCAVCGYLEEYRRDEFMENVERMETFKKGLRLFGRMP